MFHEADESVVLADIKDTDECLSLQPTSHCDTTMQRRLRRCVYRAIGPLLYAALFRTPVRSFSLALLAKWQLPKNRIERAIFPVLFRVWEDIEYLVEQDPDRREQLKAICMGSESGAAWAAEYDSRPIDLNTPLGNMTLGEAWPIYNELNRFLAEYQGTVVQIGCGSGREILWFASRHRSVRFIGTDPYRSVIEYARRHACQNASFQVLSATSVPSIVQEGWIVYSSGSLQYVQPEHLKETFRGLSVVQNVRLYVMETGHRDRYPLEIEESLYRGSFKWSHNYRLVAERVGMRILDCKILTPHNNKNVSHYYLSAVTSGAVSVS